MTPDEILMDPAGLTLLCVILIATIMCFSDFGRGPEDWNGKREDCGGSWPVVSIRPPSWGKPREKESALVHVLDAELVAQLWPKGWILEGMQVKMH